MNKPILFDPAYLPETRGKIQYASMSVDENPEYTEFIIPAMKQWKSLGIHPVVSIISDRNEITENEYGTVEFLKKHPTLPTSFQSQYARIYTASRLGLTVVSDIDLLPLDVRYFNWLVSFITDEQIVMSNTQPWCASRYAFCYSLAHGDTFRKIFKTEDKSFAEFMEYVIKIVPVAWHSDEFFMLAHLKHIPENGKVELARHTTPMVSPYRVYRNVPYMGDFAIDFHCPRPYSTNAEYIQSILEKFTVR